MEIPGFVIAVFDLNPRMSIFHAALKTSPKLYQLLFEGLNSKSQDFEFQAQVHGCHS